MRKALYILGQLTDLDIEWMIEHGRREVVPQGHVLIRQGQPVENLYITLSGHVSVIDEKMGGKELARLGSGEIVGEMSFIDARPPSATVQGADEATVLVLSKTALQNRIDQDPAFSARFHRALAIFLSDRLRATVSRLGYGAAPGAIEEDEAQDDELDLNVLDTVHLAGNRFDRILKRLSDSA